MDNSWEDMWEALLRVGAYFLLFFVVVLIAVPIKNAIRKKALKKYPLASELYEIKDEVRRLQKKGHNYKSVISALRSKFPYPKYIMEGFIIDVENEEKTIVEDPKNSIKYGFKFNYPQNWKIKALDSSFDAERYFTVEGSYSGIVSYTLFDGEGADMPSLNELNESLSREYKNYKIKDKIARWGDFYGEGNLFTADVLNNHLTGKIFLYTNNDRGFSLTLASMDDDYDNVIEGFKMIEESFQEL